MTSRCPTCNSPSPERHPAQGFEGEVTLCTDAWHAPAQPEPAAPTEPLDRMVGKAWDRFQSHAAELQALENCRLYASRHRKEEWAAVIRRFCAEGGATGSPLREAAPTVVEPPLGEGEADLTVAYLAGFHEGKRAATPPRAALTDEQIEQIGKQFLDHGYAWEGLQPWVYSFARAIETAHGIAADRGEKR